MSVYWSYIKLSSLDDTKNIFDSEILGEVEEGERPKIEVIAYTALQQEVQDLKDTFSKAGFPLKGISSHKSRCRYRPDKDFESSYVPYL